MNQLRPSVIVTAAAATPKAIAEQLRQAVKQAKWQTGRITVSVGIASAIKTDNETTILQRADKALYASKENGRNLITHSIDLTSI